MGTRFAPSGVRVAAVLGALVAALSLMLGRPGPAQADGLVTDCTETGLANALNAGSGLITFSCGLNPVVINMTLQDGGLNIITGRSNTIDGGDKVTLSGANTQRLFDVRVNAALTLTHIILTNGYAATLGNLPDWGGAILAEGNRLALDHVTIRNSQSLHFGGAIRVVTGTVFITDSLLENNRAGYGGAIDGFGTLTLVNTIVRGNQAVTASGGGLSLGGLAIISHSQIYSNTANGAGGAGLYLTGTSQATILDSQITSNTATNAVAHGGGIVNFGTLTVAGGSLSGNRANIGVGLANEKGSAATLGTLSINGNIASDAGLGGGIYNRGALTMSNATLSGNSVPANGIGGGLTDDKGATVLLVNNTFAGNTAGHGGAISHSLGRLTLINDTISGNTAMVDGGGLEAPDTSVITLTNVTFSGNSAPTGGGIFLNNANPGDSLTLLNTIVANSPAGGNCYVDPGSFIDITSAGFNLSDDGSCSAYFNHPGDLSSQPALLLPLANNGGYTPTHLPQHTSPAINNGTGLGCPAGDQRGQPRPSGGICDIGAVEVQPTDLDWALFLPAARR